jgi:hypothetical protein
VSEGDPVSWLVIEPGWTVVDSGGEEIGQVEQIVGDTGNDIFNGLTLATGLLKSGRYVPAERVTKITEGRVHLDLDSGDVELLERFKP